MAVIIDDELDVTDPAELAVIESALAAVDAHTHAQHTTITTTIASSTHPRPAPKRQLPQSFLRPARHAAHAVPQQPTDHTLEPEFVHYVATAHDIEYWAHKLLHHVRPAVVGMDTEWRVLFQTGVSPPRVALLQLCFRLSDAEAVALGMARCASYHPSQPHAPVYVCLLFHLVVCGDTLPLSLQQLLCEESIIKVGVGVEADANRIMQAYNNTQQVKGLQDLRVMAKRVIDPQRMLGGYGLSSLCAELLHATLGKDARVRCSNWEQVPLDTHQRRYAAADACASLRCYEVMAARPPLHNPLRVTNTDTCTDTVSCGTGTTITTTTIATTATAATAACIEQKAWGVMIPAVLPVERLQPAKQATWNAVVHEGQSTASVATQRAIRHDTVLSYLSEGVLAGYTYDPGHLGITRATAARVIQVLRVRAPEAVGVCEAGGEHDVLRMLQETVGAGLRDVYGWVEGMGSEGGMGLGALRLVVAHVGRVLRAGVKYV